MWFKKKSVLQSKGYFYKIPAADGDDWQTFVGNKTHTWSVSRILPSVAEAHKYFYLPALGFYGGGYLYGVGQYGYYWSSNAQPTYFAIGQYNAYALYFDAFGVNVAAGSGRNMGFRAQPFSDFGDN